MLKKNKYMFIYIDTIQYKNICYLHTGIFYTHTWMYAHTCARVCARQNFHKILKILNFRSYILFNYEN